MPKEVVFNTQTEAEAQQQLDFDCYMACHNDNPDYVSQTTSWATPRQRIDGKWAYFVCPHQDYSSQTVEDYDPANYPQEED